MTGPKSITTLQNNQNENRICQNMIAFCINQKMKNFREQKLFKIELKNVTKGTKYVLK